MDTRLSNATLDNEALARYTVLAVNTGSTSTKVAVYQGTQAVVEISIAHSTEELSRFASVPEQYEWRKDVILHALEQKGFDIIDYPYAYNMHKNQLTLPMNSVITDEEAQYVIDTFLEVYQLMTK